MAVKLGWDVEGTWVTADEGRDGGTRGEDATGQRRDNRKTAASLTSGQQGPHV